MSVFTDENNDDILAGFTPARDGSSPESRPTHESAFMFAMFSDLRKLREATENARDDMKRAVRKQVKKAVGKTIGKRKKHSKKHDKKRHGRHSAKHSPKRGRWDGLVEDSVSQAIDWSGRLISQIIEAKHDRRKSPYDDPPSLLPPKKKEKRFKRLPHKRQTDDIEGTYRDLD